MEWSGKRSVRGRLWNVSITQIIPMDIVDETAESCANATCNTFKLALHTITIKAIDSCRKLLF